MNSSAVSFSPTGDAFPDHFLPGDGSGAATPDLPKAADPPAIAPPVAEKPRAGELVAFEGEDVRETLREAEQRIARIQEEEDALQHRQEVLREFLEDKAEFNAYFEETVARFTQLARSLEEETHESIREAKLMDATVESIRYQLQRLDEIEPERWSQGRMLRELDRALELLASVERDFRTEMRRLDRELAGGNRGRSRGLGWVGGSVAGWITNGFGFLLPLLVFLAVAAILLLTALGRA